MRKKNATTTLKLTEPDRQAAGEMSPQPDFENRVDHQQRAQGGELGASRAGVIAAASPAQDAVGKAAFGKGRAHGSVQIALQGKRALSASPSQAAVTTVRQQGSVYRPNKPAKQA